MKRFSMIIDQMMEWLCFISISGFTFLVFLQIICRHILKNPLHWQEEVCMYLFFITVLAGSIRAVKNSEHISVNFINQRLNEKQQLLLKIIVSVFILVCCLFLTYSGYRYATSVGNRRSGELRIMMKYIYSMFPVLGILMSIYSVRNIAENCKNFFNKRDQ